MTNSSSESNENMNGISAKERDVDLLRKLCTDNAEYFAKDSTENGQRLYISFLAIKDALNELWPKVLRIQEQAAAYDFDEETPGNGYRSFIIVANLAVKHGIDLNNRILAKRGSVLFRKSVLTKEIECCSQLMSSLDTCFKHLETLLIWSTKGSLFPKEEHSAEELLSFCEEVNQYCFYGRSMGFQFCESLRNVLQFIALSMAIFSEVYYSQGSLISKATSSFVTTTKYITDPEQRARRIVNISQNAGVDFCKAFWFLSESELMAQLPSVVSPNVAVSKIIHIPPEPLTIVNDKGEEIEVPIPSSYLGNKPVQVRLVSHKVREGMMGTKNKTSLEKPSRGLIVHCHGGGFVAQSSKSHEGYLRDWAKQVDVPILSIDYSLAPEAPFPRALEEVLYAYCWALKHHDLLGSTGERVIAAGDSAGANLLLSTTLKCIDLQLPPPMGLVVAYCPTVVNLVPSPSRLLCMMDPLLPFGFLIRCLKAYACPDPKFKQIPTNSNTNSDTESFEEISESDLAELQAHKSPVSDASDTLTYGSLTSNIDEGNEAKPPDVSKSQKYVADFLEKYVLESDTETDGTKISVVNAQSTSSSTTFDSSLQNRVSTFVTNLRGRFFKFLGERSLSGAEQCLDVERQQSLIDEFKFTVPKDPFLSPFLASDEDLKKFPPTRILTVHLDPCLDDCVMFAKKLKYLGNDVKLNILDGLPHGFLNFASVSKEAYEGSKLCVQRLTELLDLDHLPPLQ